MESTPEQLVAVADIRRRVVGGCGAGEFAALRCPACGSALRLDSHPRPGGAALVFVACSVSTAHLGFTDRAGAAPAWWAEHQSGGWIVE